MSPTRPDILFIMTDQQRFDTIAALGNSRTRTSQFDQSHGQPELTPR